MRLIRFGDADNEKPGVILEDGTMLDVSGFGEDYDESFFASGGASRLQRWLIRYQERAPRVIDNLRLGPPIKRPGKIVCVGLNFSDHARETGALLPEEPVLFQKAVSAVCGPNDPLILPQQARKMDYEVELALVIGKRASYVSPAEALEYVFGFCLHNDFSERAFQKERGGQWMKGKSCDSFAPLGPMLVRRDQVPDPGALRLWLSVNGGLRQEGNTKDFIFPLEELVSYISRFMTLMPGDVISTGTPSGVAHGMEKPEYLQVGDVVRYGIEGLGEARRDVVASW